LIKLRSWSRDLRLAILLIVAASAISSYLPFINKDTFLHHAAWFSIHPFWGLGFFIVVNRMVLAEQSWWRTAKLPSLVSHFATLGLFSYSLYLTHELVIMQSWQWTIQVGCNWLMCSCLRFRRRLYLRGYFSGSVRNHFMTKRKQESHRFTQIDADLSLSA
jgi:peptidoglycan/LPS O-acetylase OafA/YrhL